MGNSRSQEESSDGAVESSEKVVVPPKRGSEHAASLSLINSESDDEINGPVTKKRGYEYMGMSYESLNGNLRLVLLHRGSQKFSYP